MRRAIIGYHLDEQGDWVAELSCGHGQHIRHRPPFQLRGWVLEAEGRGVRLGTPLDCPLCDRAELPDGLPVVRVSPRWDEHTMPSGLKRAHRIAAGTWGRIVVHEGQLHFVAQTEPELNVVLVSGSTQAIPPEIEHEVQPLGRVCFSIDFLSIRQHERGIGARDGKECEGNGEGRTQDIVEEGGESACLAHLLCEGCGAVLDGGPHMDGCRSGASH